MRKKHIAINAVMYSESLGGVATYIRNLVTGALNTTSPDWEIITFASKNAKSLFGESCYDLHYTYLPAAHPVPRILGEKIYWPYLIKRHKIDLFHSPISYIPPGVNIPAIMTIHDLRYFHFPETYTRLRRNFLEKMIPISAKRAWKIIAVSEYTKKDIIEKLGIPPEKIIVIHEGIDSKKFTQQYDSSLQNEIKKKYQLPSKYILAVGHLEPRKNYIRLLEAFKIFKEKYKSPHSLVIVGQENWFYKNIYKRVNELKIDNFIHFTGYVPDDDLVIIYKSATVFIAPSIFEGFGLTPLEAMAAGVPVIVSNAAAHPEICGDAALYFNPYNIDEIAETLEQTISNEHIREMLKQKAVSQISKFKWSDCCSKTFQLYKHCLEQLEK